MEIKLEGLLNSKEIANISGKGISFKKIRIPDENCSNFLIKYEIINLINNNTISEYIACSVSPYQRDVSQVTLHKSILIPDQCKLVIQIESILKHAFTGIAFIDYEIFVPTVEPNIESGLKVFISENDRQNAFRAALINLAQFFNIPNWEYDDNQTLYDKIKLLDIPIVNLLQDYFKAYDEWFKFYARIKEIETQTGHAHELNNFERNELAGFINNRESTLNALQTKFDELQFDKFKKLHGLDNVNGINI